MKHHTKDKGDLAVLKVMASLGSQDFLILNPLTEHAPFDLVVYKDKSFKRIQVKYKSQKNECISVSLRSCWSDKNGTHVVPLNKSEVDIIAIYCPETDCCYYIDASLCNQTINLRLSTPKNNQTSGVRLAKDYTRIA